MKKRLPLVFLFVCHMVFSQTYIHDVKSVERQQALKKDRTKNLLRDVSTVVGSVFFYALTDGQVNIMYNDDIRIKKISLENTSKDTLYINMMCDMMWNEEDFCDFLDIRLPPQQECKLLVPRHTRYNLHFRTTVLPQNNDLMIEIDTDHKKRIVLSEIMMTDLRALPHP